MFLLNFLFFLKSISEGYILQSSNHFDLHSDQKFHQKYLKIPNLNKSDVIIIHISSEKLSKDELDEDSIITKLSNHFRAPVFSLEHRLFGDSMIPYSDILELSTFLTIDNALADVYNFIRFVNMTFEPNCKVIVCGIGYGGSLAAWFKMRYPDLAKASFSMTPPLVSRTVLSDFDRKYSDSLPISCRNSIKNVFERISKVIESGNIEEMKEIKRILGFDVNQNSVSLLIVIFETLRLNGSDYCYMIHDTVSYEELSSIMDSVLKKMNMTRNIMDPFQLIEKSWLQCTQTGWFKSSYNILPNIINESFYQGMCNQLFGVSLLENSRINSSFGALNPMITNSVFLLDDSQQYDSLSINRNNSMGSSYSFRLNETQYAFSIVDQWVNDECNLSCVNGECRIGFCICMDGWSGNDCSVKTINYLYFRIFSILFVILPTIAFILKALNMWRKLNEPDKLLQLYKVYT